MSTASHAVCIVSSECVGPFKNGGIGTSMTGLAEMLADNGYAVTFLYTRGIYLTNKEVRHWQEHYRALNISFEALRPQALEAYDGPLANMGYLTPGAVADFLKERRFDTVHFNDTDGEGFLAVAMHRAGLLLPQATFVTNIHSPREWVAAINGEVLENPIDLPMRSAERLSIAFSDAICGPSQYLLDWLKTDYRLPDSVVQQQYVMPRAVLEKLRQRAPNRAGETHNDIKRIVFFGRLEERKGLRTFLDAANQLRELLRERAIELVFLGRSVMIDGKSSTAFIAERLRESALPNTVVTDKGQEEALTDLMQPGTLTVMASPADNSPCTVYECLELNIPFIAANRGGIPELVEEKAREHVLFDGTAGGLAQKLRHTLSSSLTFPAPAVSRDENGKRWRDLHENSFHSVKAPKADYPKNANLLVLVDETRGKTDADKTAISALRSPAKFLQQARVLILNDEGQRDRPAVPGTTRVGVQEMYDHLEGHEGPVLCVRAGLELNPEVDWPNLLNCFAQNDLDGLVLSAATAKGRRMDHPGWGGAVALSYGPCVTGCVLLRGNSIADFDPHLPEAGPFFGLLDQMIQAQKKVLPVPLAASKMSSSNASEHLPMTLERARLYQGLPMADQRALQVQARVAATVSVKTLLRGSVFKIAKSPASRLLPYIFALRERLGR
ncbi:MAG: glycosyltransferase family 4 protein [Pseudomonadota bacterium]